VYGPPFIKAKSSAVKANGYVEQLISCVIKRTIIAAISLPWILSGGIHGIPWTFQCLYHDALHNSGCGGEGSYCSSRERRLVQERWLRWDFLGFS
jgi:hypothetical protein